MERAWLICAAAFSIAPATSGSRTPRAFRPRIIFLPIVRVNSSEMEDKSYLSIVSHYESCLERHGDTHLGVDWPKKEDAETRYTVMLEIIRRDDEARRVQLLDFGCGASHLYEHIIARGIKNIDYSGLDLSERFVQLSKSKFPATEYYCVDVLVDAAAIPTFDYVVMNGVFTEKRTLAFDEMFAYFKRLV